MEKEKLDENRKEPEQSRGPTGNRVLLDIVQVVAYTYLGFTLGGLLRQRDLEPVTRVSLWGLSVLMAVMFLRSFFFKRLSQSFVQYLQPEAATPQEERARLAVAQLFADKRANNVRASSIFIIALIVSAHEWGAERGYYIVGGVVMILLWSDQLILAYRIRRGYYATNQHEAKEFLRFLLAHADKGDFSDGDGARRIFPTPEELVVGSESGSTLPGYAEA